MPSRAASGLAVRWVPNAHCDDEHFRFVGLPDSVHMPRRWLDPQVSAEVADATGVLLGPEPLIGAQRIVLRLSEQRIELGTDGLGPFTVEHRGRPAMSAHGRSKALIPERAAQGSPVRRQAHGFTLVEVLVAVAVVAIALGAGLRAAGVLIDNSQRLSDVIAAQWCAENHLSNLKLTRQFPGVGEADFSCEQLGRQYSGRMLVAGTQVSSI